MTYDDPILREFSGYMAAKDGTAKPDPDLEEPDKVSERFFRNLLLGEKNELKSRYLLIGIDRQLPCLGLESSNNVREGKRSEKSGQKKAVRKQKTVDRLLELLRAHPGLTQEGMLMGLQISSRSTIQKHIANLKGAGRLRRVGPDKGGHWEVVR